MWSYRKTYSIRRRDGIDALMGRDLNDINQVVAVMLLIVAIGFVTRALFFRILERSVQRRWDLTRILKESKLTAWGE